MINQIDIKNHMIENTKNKFLFPHQNIVTSYLEIQSFYFSADGLSADLWFFEEYQGKSMIWIADGLGHGAKSAISMAFIYGYFLSFLERYKNTYHTLPNPDEVLHCLKQALQLKDIKSSFDLTCFSGLIDQSNHIFWYANAGHPFPMVCFKTGELNILSHHQSSIATETEIFQKIKIELANLVFLLFYTDGFVDALDPKQKPFGRRIVQRWLKYAFKCKNDQPFALYTLQDLFLTHRYYDNVADDVTVVGLFLKGE